MAKRSDFAQKLLDDLRLRKERMAASQSYKGSKSMAGDANAYSKQTYRGSRETKTHQMNGLRNGSTQNRPSGGNKTIYIEEASKQIVPFGGVQQIGDLSMALEFALENGGKLQRVDSSGNSTSMFGFLQQFGRRSVDLNKMEIRSVNRRTRSQSTSNFPNFSHLHVQEIANGAQKLNQILRACSNGLNFDRYSIEIGKELLKGAMDLEESLRMLVNLQEASEHMISPQSKSRITLLDEDEDENDNNVNTVENKQLDLLPRFSFDKPSRNSHYIQEAAKSDFKLRLMALTYPSETTNFNQDAYGFSPSNSVSYKRSTSYGSRVKNLATLSEQKHQTTSSKSKPEKGRIPNVIAKLMGLEKLPESEDSKPFTEKDSNFKQKTDGMAKKAAGGSIKHDRKKKDAENLVPRTKKQEKMQHNQIQVIQDASYAMRAERNPEIRNTGFEVIIHEGKLPRKDVEGAKPMRGSNKANIKVEKHQNNIMQPNRSTNAKEQKGKGKGETKEHSLKNEIQQVALQTQRSSDAANALQRQTKSIVSMLQTEQRDENMLLFNNQPKSPNDLASQQLYMPYNSEPQDKRHHTRDTEQQKFLMRMQGREAMPKSLPKSMQDAVNLRERQSQATHGNKSVTEYIDAVQSKGFSNNRHHEDFLPDRNSIAFNINMQDSMIKDSSQISSPKNSKSEFTKEKTSTPPAMKEKSVHLPAIQKVKNVKAQKAETPRKVDELMIRKSARPSKTQTSTVRELKLRRHGKLSGSKGAEQVRVSSWKEAEARIVKSEQSVASMQQSNVLEELQIKSDQASKFQSHPLFDESQNLKGPEILNLNESFQNVESTKTNDQQGEVISNIVLNPLNGTQEDSTNITFCSQFEDQKASKLKIPEPLTETENQLKQILMKSQLFLNTAEALFKLNIPFNILDTGSHDYLEQGSKLALDCSYEIMKKRGKRHELTFNPCISLSITSLKICSLDDLIKQLNKDLEILKFYGRNENCNCLVEDYLPKMLESDVYSKDLDLNCMWDMGWESWDKMMMFSFPEKDDVVRDVEKHVLNGLLDELTRDLLLIYY